MYIKHLFLWLVVLAGTWARPEDESDLNLQSIFRTPKDFSKVNFDHFELLERNNFDDEPQPAPTETTEKNETTKIEEKPSKSIANAQVMLRIGGEDIHDCNRVILHRPNRPTYSDSLPLMRGNDIGYHHLPPQPIYSYTPPPPFSFPGCYYVSHPYPNYFQAPYHTGNVNVHPHDYQTQHSGRSYASYPVSRDPHVIITSQHPRKNQNHDVELLEAPIRPCFDSNDQIYSSNVEPVQTNFLDAGPYSSSLSKCDVAPSKVAYVEVNLADAGKSCMDTPRDNIATLMDQALIPLSCQKCAAKKPLLVSYPVIPNEKTICTTPEEEIIVSACPNCNQHGYCDTCNRERNPSIPYGQRFSKDVDSLFEINNSCPDSCVPSALYNEAPPESLMKIEPALPPRKLKKIFKIIPAEEEFQPQWTETNTYGEINQSPCAYQEPSLENSTGEESSTIEPPYETDWVPCAQTDTPQVPQQYADTVESPCATQTVVQTSNPCADGTESPSSDNTVNLEENWQVELSDSPSSVHVCDSCSQQVVETSNPCVETVASPQSPCGDSTMHLEQSESTANWAAQSACPLNPPTCNPVVQLTSSGAEMTAPSTWIDDTANAEELKAENSWQDHSNYLQETQPDDQVQIVNPCAEETTTSVPYPCADHITDAEGSTDAANWQIHSVCPPPAPLPTPCSQKVELPCNAQNVVIETPHSSDTGSTNSQFVSTSPAEATSSDWLQSQVGEMQIIDDNSVSNSEGEWSKPRVYFTPWWEMGKTSQTDQEAIQPSNPALSGAESGSCSGAFFVQQASDIVSNTIPTQTNCQAQWLTQTRGNAYPQGDLVASYPITSESNLQQPPVYSGGCSTSSTSQYLYDVSGTGNSQPNVYMEGCGSTSGSGYDSNPCGTVIYKQPTVIQTYEASSSPSSQYTTNVNQISKLYELPGSQQTPVSPCESQPITMSPPRVYKVVKKYDIVPREDLKPVSVQNLVPANQYLTHNAPGCSANNPPVYQDMSVPPENLPLIKNEFYIHGWPLYKPVPVQREVPVPLSSSYNPICTSCAKYKGELNELSCES